MDLSDEFSEDAGGRLRWGSRGAGILFRRPAGKVLLVLRSGEVMDPHVWGVPGGRVEPGEPDEEAAIREAIEELGVVPPFQILAKDVYTSGDFRYTTFLASVKESHAKLWRPELNWENDDWGWFSPRKLPKPLHSGVKRVIDRWK